MAWSSTTVAGSVLSTNYIHDFESGVFTLPFTIVPGFEQVIIGSTLSLTSRIRTTDSFIAGGSGSPGLVANPTSGFTTGVISTGNICLNANVQGGVRNILVAGETFTRSQVIAYDSSSSFNGNIAGPYVVAYNTEGIKTVDVYLYFRFGFGTGHWQNFGPNPPIGLPQQPSFPPKSFTFEVVQQAISVTRRNSVSGVILSDGSSINDMDTLTNSSIVLNKESNRGDSVQSEWFILKQDSTTGVYDTALLSSDYTFNSGETSTTDQVTITWVNPGNYRVINTTTGSSVAGPNTNNSLVNFNVGQSVVDTVTLPTVTALITPVTAFDNTIVSTDPLIGVTTFEFDVEAVVDITSASWEQQINVGVVNTLTLTPDAWTSELTSRCNVKCKVKKDGALVISRNGFGPHSFSLPEGIYDVGFEITPKSGLVLVVPLSDIAIR